MLQLYPSEERGTSRLDWLDSRHSFSFANWNDPERMGFRTLRVLNEDRIEAGTGFGAHSHRDMEILTVVLAGALEHRDSSGSQAILRAGDVQCMSAGRGVTHSEWNASDTDELHLIQIWIEPAERGTEPSHAESREVFSVGDTAPVGLRPLASDAGGAAALRLRQAARMFGGRVTKAAPLDYELEAGRGAWIQAIAGELDVNGTQLSAGDGLAVEEEGKLAFSTSGDAAFLLFDLG